MQVPKFHTSSNTVGRYAGQTASSKVVSTQILYRAVHRREANHPCYVHVHATPDYPDARAVWPELQHAADSPAPVVLAASTAWAKVGKLRAAPPPA